MYVHAYVPLWYRRVAFAHRWVRAEFLSMGLLQEKLSIKIHVFTSHESPSLIAVVFSSPSPLFLTDGHRSSDRFDGNRSLWRPTGSTGRRERGDHPDPCPRHRSKNHHNARGHQRYRQERQAKSTRGGSRAHWGGGTRTPSAKASTTTTSGGGCIGDIHKKSDGK